MEVRSENPATWKFWGTDLTQLSDLYFPMKRFTFENRIKSKIQYGNMYENTDVQFEDDYIIFGVEIT